MTESFRSLVEDYLDSEYDAYIATVKADYLAARAEAKALSLRVKMNRNRELSSWPINGHGLFMTRR